MRTTTLVLAILMAVPAIALVPTATADEERAVYHWCQFFGEGYNCRGVTQSSNGTGVCYTEWSDDDYDSSPYDGNAHVTYQQCVLT